MESRAYKTYKTPVFGFPFGGLATAVIATIAVFLPRGIISYPETKLSREDDMETKEGKKTGRPRKYGSDVERVRAWRSDNFRKAFRTEVVLSMDDAVHLDILRNREGLTRSDMIRKLIERAFVSGNENGEG
ncbi:MAG: Hypothetical protein C75L2_00790014 [Leptospirillum sp. Group II 'C75']|uniref:Uncharacterized protein n=2 Tax=Leptospirillum sp. Group II TaxID=261385 RepID=B6AQ54_9BACT|nr:hypothetical protein ABH19_02990 [Leptospirillum sp. Group II 'CF-1']EDZ38375.1 MAG: Hypothetical protein CGL2_07414001 [Leptospirillum sp. Group II '5-way CG']EIJ76912.1 MAG: Hypothetical protein C75L2_00790014 [Leptospirillum sp. Group II 'C75']